MKVTIVGAGAVGASCAEYIALKNFCSEVVLIDIKEGFAEGKSMDLMQTASLNNFDTKIIGSTNDYSHSKDSSVAVITSGIPRKPGMTREELIGINANIVKDVTSNILKYSSNPIIVMVSNPMDTMTYLALKSTGLDPTRVIGMGGALDSSRFKTYISLSSKKSRRLSPILMPSISKSSISLLSAYEKKPKIKIIKNFFMFIFLCKHHLLKS